MRANVIESAEKYLVVLSSRSTTNKDMIRSKRGSAMQIAGRDELLFYSKLGLSRSVARKHHQDRAFSMTCGNESERTRYALPCLAVDRKSRMLVHLAWPDVTALWGRASQSSRNYARSKSRYHAPSVATSFFRLRASTGRCNSWPAVSIPVCTVSIAAFAPGTWCSSGFTFCN